MLRVRPTPLQAPLKMPWKRGIAVGRAYELLRADTQAHLSFIQRGIGFRFCRFHGLFHDDVGVAVRLPSGDLAFQWGHIDRIFDFLLSIGLRPFVELGPMPAALSSGPTTFFHWRMNVTPPRDWDEWKLLVTSFAEHCVQRYGLAEVRRWYFEVWNEPNLQAFWTGSQEDYWRLYACSAQSLKSVDAHLRVGGPASAEAGWIGEFLCFCEKSGTPVDFVSTHAYPQNEFGRYTDRDESPHMPGMYLVDTIREVKSKVGQWKGGGIEIHWTEWSTLDAENRESVDWYANDTIDRLYSAALVCHICASADEDADSLFWWVASDIFEEMGMPQSPFSNNFGMLTVDGIPKASYHAFCLLAKMTGLKLAVETGETDLGRGAIATEDVGILRLLLWNHVPLGEPAEAWTGQISIPSGPSLRMGSSIKIRDGAGSAYEPWLKAGRPQNPTPTQMEALRAVAQPQHELFQLDPNANTVDFSIHAGEVLFIELSGPPDPYVAKGSEGAGLELWNQALTYPSPT